MEGLLTLHEVMEFLDLNQKQVEGLVQKGKLDAYKIGGAFLRFKKEQVTQLRVRIKPGEEKSAAVSRRASDFWSFNRLYILSAILFVLLMIVLVR